MSLKAFPKSGKALTLLELLVVLLLMSLSLALVAPRLGNLLPQKTEDFSTNLVLLLRRARINALLTNQIWLVVIDPDSRKIFLSEKKPDNIHEILTIPEEIEIKASNLIKEEGKYLIAFLAGGLSSGGELEIISHKSEEHLLILLARTQVYVHTEGI